MLHTFFRPVLPITLLSVLFCLPIQATPAKQLPVPVKLICQDVPFPIGLTEAPELSWQTLAGPGFFQSAYRIEVASSLEKLAEERPDVWESGKVAAAVQSRIPCPDESLASYTRHFWRVKLWDASGNEGPWSEPACFVTGPRKRSLWRAKTLLSTFPAVGMARKTFMLKATPAEAWLFVAVGGEKSNACNVYLNGARVGDDWLRPGPQEYVTLGMRGYDVTALLQKENVINCDYVHNLSALLQVRYADGSSEQIVTDSTWRLYNGPCPYLLGHTNHVMNHGKCETFDASLYPAAWYTKEYDDSACKTVLPPSSITWNPLIIRYQPLGTPIDTTLSPVEIRPLSRGRYLVDFGLNVSGFPEFTLHGCTDTVMVRTAEHLTPEDEVNMRPYGSWAPPFIKYVPTSAFSESYRPRFMHTSFRYLIVEGLPYRPAPADFKAFFIHSEVKKQSAFACSNADLNFLYGCIERGFRANLINLPTDCPGRERRGWTGDSFVVVEAQSIVCNAYPLYRQWLTSQQDAQRLNGWVSVEFPMMTDDHIDLVWPMSIIIDPWELYRQSGDKQVLVRMHESMTKYMDLLRTASDPDELPDESLFSYGDWCALEKASKPFLGAAYYYRVADLMAQVERVLGDEAKARDYDRLREKIGTSINRVYLHRDAAGRTYYDNGSQSSSVHALYFGICPEAQRQSVFDYILEDIRKHEVHTSGFMGNTWIYPLLAQYGRNDLAYSLLTSDVPKRGNLLWYTRQWGATMLPENYEGSGSLSHAFFGGGPALWLFQNLGGITPAEPGYKEFAVAPWFASELDFLQVAIETDYGMIALDWKRRGRNIRLHLEVPANTTARLSLPGDQEARKMASGSHDLDVQF